MVDNYAVTRSLRPVFLPISKPISKPMPKIPTVMTLSPSHVLEAPAPKDVAKRQVANIPTASAFSFVSLLLFALKLLFIPLVLLTVLLEVPVHYSMIPVIIKYQTYHQEYY